ncbi:MAG: beta-N-acetylhexosaminidase [Xanthomonadales bacterium]|nr:beta-N-acetylhexosaminidase [Gammaproteobacteria bacterium]MBT8053254.1 beta-N-acetylhexosaminidase [Gammaproteobacteria bacterium]NND56051.1 beta-N-acetylhexosaminidase [Xanthomonadales bacterium]NNK50294.1 beta-N-acetylhexosaminidase [Xanthomonadales bacterium]
MKSGPILIGIPGFELDRQSCEHLEHPDVGGVVLFSRNFVNPARLDRLIADIRALDTPRPLICIDQEGGRVQRLKDGFTRLPPLGALGRMGRYDPEKALDYAYRHGRVMATEMLASGIDLSFAPVLDLDRGSCVIGDRSFSSDPAEVLRLGRAYLAGMHDSGMKTTGKHFPGHGSTVADSHVDDVSDPRTLAEIADSDLLPFRQLAPELDALMIAHVVYPQVDVLPAGYSKTWLQGVLRTDLEYRGVIISDDLGMHAAKAVGGLLERTLLSLKAGCDLVLVCQPKDVANLLPKLDGSLDDASGSISRLYGRPTVNREELVVVDRERIREWSHWRKTLEEIGETA